MLRPNAAARKTPTWPTPTPEQVEVVLLGTYHMTGSELDTVAVDTDEVLAEKRQQELRELATRLAEAEPDLVAVERPAARTEGVNELFANYRDGEFAYEEEREFEEPHPERDDDVMSCRNEVVQIGFRLADRLGHERVVPIDVPEILGNDPAFEELEEKGIDPSPKRDVERFDPDELQETLDKRLADSTLTAYHRYLNEEAALHANDAMFDELIRYGDGDNYAGPDALAKWYRRNLRMVHNMWYAVDDDTERILCLVGSGHVHVLRQLLLDIPELCPRSALPYLPREE